MDELVGAMREKKPYKAFLLRCWEEREASLDRKPRWRFSIEEVGREKRQRGFHQLQDLLTFLEQQMERSTGDTPHGRR